MAKRKRRTNSPAPGPAFPNAASMRFDLQGSKLIGEAAALCRDEQAALAAIIVTGPLHNETLVYELLQHAGEALLGDLQDVEKIGDPQTGVAMNEMENAVVRASEAVFLEDGIGARRELAVGEEQQLGTGDELLARGAAGGIV